MATEIANIVGMLGVVLLLLAYFLLQSGRMISVDLGYSILNLIGSLMILYSLFFAWNWPAAAIESAWAIISVLGIWRTLRIKRINE